MPFALIVIAVVLVVAGARGRTDKLKELLLGDFSGEGNFINWIIAIFGAGAIGYAPEARQFSRVFMALIILSMLLAKKGFFAKFMDAVNNTKAAQWAEPQDKPTAGNNAGGKNPGVGGGLGFGGLIPRDLFKMPDGSPVPDA